ncbi:MAG: hypothetical protein K1X50_13615, partial [Candidatus Promineofilum sp.]|nr:hypothetical protein [Promineifilum sp.]
DVRALATDQRRDLAVAAAGPTHPQRSARCRDGVILASSDLDRRGQRQDGPLWRALGPLVRARAQASESEV